MFLYNKKFLVSGLSLLLATTAAILTSFKWFEKPPPIRIGVLYSVTGNMAVSETPLVKVINFAVDEINAHGGILNRPLEIVFADGRSDWQVFAAEAERLITQEKVSALFACWTSACRKAVKPIVERHSHLMFYTVQYEGLEQSPNIVYLGSTANQQIIPGTQWAINQFGEKVYLLGSDYIFPHVANHIIGDLISATTGNIVGERYFPLDTTDFSAALQDITQLQPQVIINTLNGSSNLHFFRALHESSALQNLPVLSLSVTENELQAMGSAIYHPAHYAVWNYFQSLNSEANRQFIQKFQKLFGAQQVVTDPMETTYNAVRLWATAVKELDDTDPQAINLIIHRLSLPGLTSIITMDATTRHAWRWVRIGQARPDGQFDTIQTLSKMVRPMPFPVYHHKNYWQQIIENAASDHKN